VYQVSAVNCTNPVFVDCMGTSGKSYELTSMGNPVICVVWFIGDLTSFGRNVIFRLYKAGNEQSSLE
jgi:hypothetical protein